LPVPGVTRDGVNRQTGPLPGANQDAVNRPRDPDTVRDQVFDRGRGDQGDHKPGDQKHGDRDWDKGDRDRDNFRFRRFFRPGFGWWYWRWNPSIGRYYQYYDRAYTGTGGYSGYAYETAPAAPQAVLGVTFNSNLSGGAYITQVVAGSAAERAGIVPGDVIVAINGGPITSYQEVINFVLQSRPGDPIQIDVLRGGQRMTAEAVLQGSAL
jgi:hypothetical protein